MKNKVISLLIVLIMMIGLLGTMPIMVSSDNSGSCGNNAIWVYDTDTGTLTISGTGDMNNYASRTDVPWYSGGITSIIIKNGITSIGSFAFCYCKCLTSITIPNSVKTIGDHAFFGCESLSSIIIPNSVTSIGDVAFHSCEGLTSITIPNSVTSIGVSAFGWCDNLTIHCYANSYAEQYAKSNGLTAKVTKTEQQLAIEKKVATDKVSALNIAKQVKKVTVKSKSKKKINVTWKKVNKAKGYEVQVSNNKNFKKPVYDKFTPKTKLVIKNSKIKSKKVYYVRVRAYSTYNDVNNKAQKVYGSWSKKTGKKVKVK